jgi:hypothetical protein
MKKSTLLCFALFLVFPTAVVAKEPTYKITPDVVYGLQGTPYGGGGVETSTLIDLDGEVTQQDKTVYGDVELPIPGDVSPVPPPG